MTTPDGNKQTAMAFYDLALQRPASRSDGAVRRDTQGEAGSLELAWKRAP